MFDWAKLKGLSSNAYCDYFHEAATLECILMDDGYDLLHDEGMVYSYVLLTEDEALIYRLKYL